MNENTQEELIPLTPGDLLRHSRERKGWSIDQAAAMMRLRPEILSSIESAETSHIPSVYLKGYIRAYARVLGLKPESIERCLPQARGADPEVQPVFQQPLPRNPAERWMRATSYAMASVVVIALVWQFTNEAVRFSQGGPLLRGAAAEAPSPASTGQPGSAASRPAEAAETRRLHLRASIAPMELDGLGNVPIAQDAAVGAWAAIGNPEPAAQAEVAAPGEGLAVRLVTSADSWVEITDGNGQQIEMDLLRAGSQRSYRAHGPLNLLIGRAAAVEVYLDGEKVDIAPYTRGNVARVVLHATPETEAIADGPAAKVLPGAEEPQPADQG